MIKKLGCWLKKETVFTISALAALLSMLFTPPSASYKDYIDFSVLSLLFCLMAVVAGLRQSGVLDAISAALLRRVSNTRQLAGVLILLCFFSSMLITNDVALLTFIPLALQMLLRQGEQMLIGVVVLQTIAANVGSLVTPVGNPQNIYLYTRYGFTLPAFLQLTLPLGGICLLLLVGSLLFIEKKPLVASGYAQHVCLQRAAALKFIGLFGLCLLTVVGILPHSGCFLLLSACLLLTDRALFFKIDYPLLLTFVCFFVFVGNLSQNAGVHGLLSAMLSGHELLMGVAVSQVFSNVPAAVLLSGFTEQAPDLVLGTNIGGLGTLVASLASLISYRIYTGIQPQNTLSYFKTFTLLNLLYLGILLPVGWILLHWAA